MVAASLAGGIRILYNVTSLLDSSTASLSRITPRGEWCGATAALEIGNDSNSMGGGTELVPPPLPSASTSLSAAGGVTPSSAMQFNLGGGVGTNSQTSVGYEGGSKMIIYTAATAALQGVRWDIFPPSSSTATNELWVTAAAWGDPRPLD